MHCVLSTICYCPKGFDDDDMDILPNTPPERRLSVLFDLDAIMLTIGGDEDEVLATSSQTSLGGRRASESNLLEPTNSYSAHDLLLPHKGSGCKSSLSMQRQLTPVGEELASAASKADNKTEMHSEVAVMTVMSGEITVIGLTIIQWILCIDDTCLMRTRLHTVPATSVHVL